MGWVPISEKVLKNYQYYGIEVKVMVRKHVGIFVLAYHVSITFLLKQPTVQLFTHDSKIEQSRHCYWLFRQKYTNVMRKEPIFT